MDAQALLKDVSQMPLLELERFVQAVNGLITQKKTTDKSYRERFLLRKINETVLGIAKQNAINCWSISTNLKQLRMKNTLNGRN